MHAYWFDRTVSSARLPPLRSDLPEAASALVELQRAVATRPRWADDRLVHLRKNASLSSASRDMDFDLVAVSPGSSVAGLPCTTSALDMVGALTIERSQRLDQASLTRLSRSCAQSF